MAHAEEAAGIARLTGQSGTVFVDLGDGFVQSGGEVALMPGDRVLVADDGAAILDFGDNCTLTLAAPSLTVVKETECTLATQGDEGTTGEGNNGAGAALALALVAAVGVGGYVAFEVLPDPQNNSMSP